MIAATGYDVFKHYELFTLQDIGLIAVGFIAAFLAGLLAIKSLLKFRVQQKLRSVCLLPHRLRRIDSADLGDGLGQMGSMMLKQG